jgi:hypothetical protein
VFFHLFVAQNENMQTKRRQYREFARVPEVAVTKTGFLFGFHTVRLEL